MTIVNHKNTLNFFLFLSIFLASTLYLFFRELHFVRIMIPLFLITILFRRDGKLIVPHYVRNILLLLSAYLIYMYVITFINNREISVNDLVNYSFLYLMSVVIFLQFSNGAEKSAAALFYAGLAFYLMNIGLGYYEYLTGWHFPHSAVLDKPTWYQHIPTTFYTNQNDFSTMHFLIFLYLYKYTQYFMVPSVKKIILLLFPISLFLYIVTSSRIVLISIILWLIIEFRLKLFPLFLFAIIMLALFFPLLFSELFNMVDSLWLNVTTNEIGLPSVRLALYEYGLRSIGESYGLGFGINASANYFSELNVFELRKIINPHSYIIELIVNGGVLAFLGYVGLASYMTSLLHKKQRITFIWFLFLYTFLLFSPSSSLYLWGHYLIFVGYWYLLMVVNEKQKTFMISLETT